MIGKLPSSGTTRRLSGPAMMTESGNRGRGVNICTQGKLAKWLASVQPGDKRMAYR
jgi:hypothetical protein